jgi:hypothetical protein
MITPNSKSSKTAFWEDPTINSQMDILRMEETLCDRQVISQELVFETETDAIQYLADLTGKEVRIKNF